MPYASLLTAYSRRIEKQENAVLKIDANRGNVSRHPHIAAKLAIYRSGSFCCAARESPEKIAKLIGLY